MAQDERQVHWKGTDGDDTHAAGPLDSELDGGKGDDTLTGSQLSDTLYGDDGDDILFGLDGKDCIYGGQGNDRLIGGRGNDNLYGGLGADTFVFMAGDGNWNQVSDFGDGDIIEFRGIEGGFAGLEIRAHDEAFGTEVHYGDGGDMIILWGVAPADLDESDFRFMEDCEDCEDDGMPSGDALQTAVPAQGAPEHDHGEQAQQQSAGSVPLSPAEEHGGPVDGRTLTGGDGDDTLRGSKANDLLSGGMGNDTLRGGSGNDQLYGGTSNASADQVRHEMEDVTDDDLIHGKRGDDFIDGGMGDDTLHGGKGKDKLFGGMGDDTLYGGKGVDHLEGGQGDDRLIGGEGYDCYYGGLGNDTLVFSIGDGSDHVSGFGDGDIIELRGVSGGFDGLDIRQRDDGLGTDVRYGDGDDVIVLWSVTTVDENDFSFVVA